MANSTPPEIMEEICQHLTTEELKTTRLICRSFDPVAQKNLFKAITVKTNLESFQKLSSISHHPILKNHVRKVTYDGRLMPDTISYRRQWLTYGTGYKSPSFQDFFSPEKKIFRDTLTQEELRDHTRYHRYIESQNGARANDKQMQWLVKACISFNNLEAVAYGDLIDHNSSRIPFERKPPMSWMASSPIAQQALTALQAETDWERCALSFPILLIAAHMSPGQLKSLEAAVSWEMFDFMARKPVFLQNVKTLRQLTLEISSCKDRPMKLDSLVNFIANASVLQKLELSFSRRRAELDELFRKQTYWPTLNTLCLAAVNASFRPLKTLLEAHAHTLRTLGLSDMTLHKEPGDQNDPAAPWMSIIQSMHVDLNLTHIRFHGRLHSYSEVWATKIGIYHYDRPHWKGGGIQTYVCQNCPAHDIEHYILHGGDCRLRFSDPTE